MTTASATTPDTEADRLRLESELVTDSGAGWADEFRPGTSGCHELLDRAQLMADMLERNLLNHPACVADAEWYALADRAASALRELYQRVGAEHLSHLQRPFTLSGEPMGDEVKRELRDLAKEVLQAQDASNLSELSGLVHAWSRAITDLRRLLQNADTLRINIHPINTMWLKKLAQLNGCVLAPEELVSEAYNEVVKIAEM